MSAPGLASRFAGAGYDGSLIEEEWAAWGGARPADALAAGAAIAATAPDKATLVRVFMANETEPRSALEAAIGADAVERCIALGLLAAADHGLAAPHRVVPVDGLLIASDHPGSGRLERDFVIGVHLASLLVARNTPRRPAGRALDLGCGAGVQGLLAARHAEHVVATDVNPRALELARLNARLNGLQLDLREGSWFEPVGDESFDLVAANPPFAISPDSDFVFRDSGLEGDNAARLVVEGAVARLASGGFATVLTEWIGAADVPWEWIKGTGASLLTLHVDTVTPSEHAVRWNDGLARRDADRFRATVARWTAAARQRGIEQISLGALVVHADGRGADLGTLDYLRGTPTVAGDQIEAIFDNAALAPADHHVFEPLVGLRVNQTIRRGHEKWRASEATVRADPGIRARITLTREELRALFALDGTRSLGELGLAADIVQKLLDNGLIRLKLASSPTRED